MKWWEEGYAQNIFKLGLRTSSREDGESHLRAYQPDETIIDSAIRRLLFDAG